MTNPTNNKKLGKYSTRHRSLGVFHEVEECYDGTLCENGSRCIPHPLKEGSYMCDCDTITDETSHNGGNRYAGLFCEHKATSFCQKGGSISSHAFCTNNGECKEYVSRNQDHVGCKCPKGYEGDYCQFVEGSVPTDWQFINPAIAGLYGSRSDSGSGFTGAALIGVVIGSVVGFVIMAGLLAAFLWNGKMRRDGKETVEATNTGNGATSPSNGSFIGGVSVYKKKSSTKLSVVTQDTMEADGGVLTAALEDQTNGDDLHVEDENGHSSPTKLQEVSLDDLPSSLDTEEKDPKEIC